MLIECRYFTAVVSPSRSKVSLSLLGLGSQSSAYGAQLLKQSQEPPLLFSYSLSHNHFLLQQRCMTSPYRSLPFSHFHLSFGHLNTQQLCYFGTGFSSCKRIFFSCYDELTPTHAGFIVC